MDHNKLDLRALYDAFGLGVSRAELVDLGYTKTDLVRLHDFLVDLCRFVAGDTLPICVGLRLKIDQIQTVIDHWRK